VPVDNKLYDRLAVYDRLAATWWNEDTNLASSGRE
jgi:hypothetical protein